MSQSLAHNTLSAVFAKSRQFVRPNVWWGLYNETMFMARYGPVDSSRSQNILSMTCDDHLGFGVFTVEQYGSDQQVVKNMDDIYPGVEVSDFDGKYVDFDATKKGKKGYRITSVGAWQGHFYFVLTKNVAQFSAKEQAFFTTDKWESVDSMIVEMAESWQTQSIVTSICYCEKKKKYLVVMTQSDAKQQSRWDKGKGKKNANWTRDMERQGYHLTIVFKDPSDGMILRAVTKDKSISSSHVITDVPCLM